MSLPKVKVKYKIGFWFFNAILFNLCKLIPFRNKKLWIFGANGGHNYDDNSRYLFEYVNKYYSNTIMAIWIASDKTVVNNIKKKGYNACINSSWKGIKAQLRAGAAFYTHGLYDFGVIPLIGGSKVVALWHGVSCKKIYNSKYSSKKRKIKEFLDFFFSRTYRNITLITSEYTRIMFKDWFSLDNDANIYITGQPRNDVFKYPLRKDIVLKDIDIDPDKQLILYLPTYRSKSLGKNAVAKIVRSLYDSQELSDALDATNSVFIVKLHPMTPCMNLRNRDNFCVFNYEDIKSNQELLGIGDILITDYSSTCTDFALLNRPIIFYIPNQTDFLEKSELIYDEWFALIDKCYCTTPSGLADIIINPTLSATEAINNLFEDPDIKGTCYSENVYKVVSKEVGI